MRYLTKKEKRFDIAKKIASMDPDLAKRFAIKPREGIVMLTDWSPSMAGDKEEALKTTIKKLIPTHPYIRLIRFPGAEKDVVEFETNQIDQMEAGGISTPMGEALEMAWEINPKMMVLITDGMPNTIPGEEILGRARRYRLIPIHCFGIGDPDKKELDEKFLKALASITGGSYRRIGEEQLYLLKEGLESLLLEYKRKEG